MLGNLHLGLTNAFEVCVACALSLFIDARQSMGDPHCFISSRSMANQKYQKKNSLENKCGVLLKKKNSMVIGLQ